MKPEDWLESEEGKAALTTLESTEQKTDSQPTEPPKEQPKETTGKGDQTPPAKTVRLKTPKGEFDVPEAVAEGFLRQDDYTRKTQDLSRKEQELRSRRFSLEAFEANPDEWIKRNRPELLSAKTEEKQPEPEPKDPGEKALKRVETLEHEHNVEREMQKVENELNYLSREYPDLYNRAEVLDFADKNGYESAVEAFQALNFDRVRRMSMERKPTTSAAPDLAGATGIVSEPADKSLAAAPIEGPPKTDKEAMARALDYANKHGLYQ